MWLENERITKREIKVCQHYLRSTRNMCFSFMCNKQIIFDPPVPPCSAGFLLLFSRIWSEPRKKPDTGRLSGRLLGISPGTRWAPILSRIPVVLAMCPCSTLCLVSTTCFCLPVRYFVRPSVLTIRNYQKEEGEDTTPDPRYLSFVSLAPLFLHAELGSPAVAPPFLSSCTQDFGRSAREKGALSDSIDVRHFPRYPCHLFVWDLNLVS